MCSVSFIGDAYGQQIPQRWPWVQPYVQPTVTITTPPDVSREEFDALRREIEELKTLLIAAKHFDEVTGQPDCETGEKVALLKKLAALVGVDLDDVLAV